jgi:hypothetical protein
VFVIFLLFPMLDRGKLAVLTMFAVALAAAMFAWWWNYSRGQRALEFYGPKAAHLIRTAPKVELLLVGISDADPVETLPESGPVMRVIDISRAPGLVHARTALLDDASYDWNAVALPQEFEHCLRFSDGKDQVVLAFGTPSGRILIEGSGRGGSGQLVKKTAAGWLGFIDRNVKQAESGTPIHATQH